MMQKNGIKHMLRFKIHISRYENFMKKKGRSQMEELYRVNIISIKKVL